MLVTGGDWCASGGGGRRRPRVRQSVRRARGAWITAQRLLAGFERLSQLSRAFSDVHPRTRACIGRESPHVGGRGHLQLSSSTKSHCRGAGAVPAWCGVSLVSWHSGSGSALGLGTLAAGGQLSSSSAPTAPSAVREATTSAATAQGSNDEGSAGPCRADRGCSWVRAHEPGGAQWVSAAAARSSTGRHGADRRANERTRRRRCCRIGSKASGSAVVLCACQRWHQVQRSRQASPRQ
jgi:hypothetical protein